MAFMEFMFMKLVIA